MDDQRIFKQAIARFGKTHQALVAVEEFAELSKEILKDVNRGHSNRLAILEELADAEIMLGQLKLLYSFHGSEYRDVYGRKLSRLESLLEPSS